MRQQKHVPAPPIEQIEKETFSLLSPLSFKPLKLYEDKQEAFTHRPVTTWYTENSKANDKTWCEQLLERLPVGGLLI
ncbi:MAG: hypothetical protein ACYTX0_63645, partial [Nostoc sp.]